MSEDAAIRIVRESHHARAQRARSTDGRVVYAIGDIHGCYDLVTALLEAIVADMATIARGKPPLLVFCGDYVDRGPHSSQVLTALVWLSRQSTLEVAFLRGNHEVMLLGFLDQPDRHIPWLRRDGGQTLASYGIELPDDVDPAALAKTCRSLRDRLMDKLPASHLEFLRSLPITRACGDYLFVHAGLKPGVAIARQNEEDCLWIGEEFLDADYRFDKVVVHGHSWDADEPVVTANRIGIDTGAYSTGALTAVRLEGNSIAFLQARMRAGETSC